MDKNHNKGYVTLLVLLGVMVLLLFYVFGGAVPIYLKSFWYSLKRTTQIVGIMPISLGTDKSSETPLPVSEYVPDELNINYINEQLYKDDNVAFSYPGELTLVTDTKSFFSDNSNEELKNSFIFGNIALCDFKFLYDKNNPYFLIAINQGPSIEYSNICGSTFVYTPGDGKSQNYPNMKSGVKKWTRWLTNNNSSNNHTFIQYITFTPDFRDADEYKLSLINYQKHDKTLTPVFDNIIKTFSFTDSYKVPKDIEWEKFESNILPISFSYPTSWGKAQEKQLDLSNPPHNTASGYSLRFNELDRFRDSSRWGEGLGQTRSYAPGRMWTCMDFTGYRDMPEGIYFQMGADVFNCSKNTEPDPICSIPTTYAYIGFNLPGNPVADGMRLQIPVLSPYANVHNIEGIESNCNFINVTKVTDTEIKSITNEINQVLPKYDAETQRNLKIFLGILKSVEIK